jgi:hypothetical protein
MNLPQSVSGGPFFFALPVVVLQLTAERLATTSHAARSKKNVPPKIFLIMLEPSARIGTNGTAGDLRRLKASS